MQTVQLTIPYVRVIDMVNHSVNIPALVYLTQSTHEDCKVYY